MMPQADLAPYFWRWVKCKFNFRTYFEVEDFVVKLYEDVLFYVIDLLDSFSVEHIYNATMRFIKYRYGRVYCEATLQDLAEKFVNFYRMLIGVIPQNDSPFKCLRFLLSKFEEVRNAPIFQKLYKFIMYVLCTSVLEKFGASKMFVKNFSRNCILMQLLRENFILELIFSIVCLIQLFTFVKLVINVLC
jgi:hypothetical protein